MLIKKRQKGFTLIEIAIVLLIVSILLGYSVAMLPRQQELKQFKKADQEMNEIQQSIYAFAQVNGYLPCPAWYQASPLQTSNGFECRDANVTEDGNCDPDGVTDPTVQCDVWFGFVPGKTLGITGKYSAQGLLVDPWGNEYRYRVTSDDDDGDGFADFVVSGQMGVSNNVTIANLKPDLAVCNTITTSGTTCDDATETVITTAPVVILSTGKNVVASTLQDENLDADTVFISTTFSDSYDDIVKWISPNVLYSKMIESDKLP